MNIIEQKFIFNQPDVLEYRHFGWKSFVQFELFILAVKLIRRDLRAFWFWYKNLLSVELRLKWTNKFLFTHEIKKLFVIKQSGLTNQSKKAEKKKKIFEIYFLFLMRKFIFNHTIFRFVSIFLWFYLWN